jgi:2,3-bisphosphoglycerate-independent phosphoglycerate mutase
MLVILDGFGWREATADNAVAQARKPNFDRLWHTGPRAFLRTSGRDVGLPNGQMGNSEVGHLNIGAGRVVRQELVRIGDAIEDGSIADAAALAALIEAARASGGTCHLLGLVSDGGVHAHQDHAIALARIVTDAGVPVAAHIFTDGRDTGPRTGLAFVSDFVASLPPGATTATISGRYFPMDRDRRWDRVRRAYAAMADAEGPRSMTPQAAIEAAYAQDVTDEFIPPTVIDGYAGMRDGDVLLCFNFRADRVREIFAALLDPAFDGFMRAPKHFAAAAGMTHYSDALAPHMGALFAPDKLDNILGQVVADAGRAQLRLAETEKYPHVTYFLNGGAETPFAGEDRIMVPSPKVATYDLQPEMSAAELTDRAVAAIDSARYDLLVLNFANPDMVGHTGSLAAAIRAVEAVDAGLGRIADAVARQGGALLVTADHGNCELMRDPVTGGPHTSHTTNPVPLFLSGRPDATLADGRLADLAPTLLDLMGLPAPAEMSGMSLLRK